MKNLTKNAILGTLILIPLAVFVFLYGFGKNYYEIDIYHSRWVVEVDIDGEIFYDTLRDASQVEGKKIIDTLYHTIPNFQFANQAGQEFSSEELEGKIYVADFFFTRCGNPTLCPRMSAEMRRVQQSFLGNETLKLISFTVDPEYDSPEVLLAYAQEYEADLSQWYFLTGAKEKIYNLAYQGFKVSAMDESTSVTPEFLHATKFMLIDQKGRVRGYYEGTDREEIDRLIIEIKVLMSEGKGVGL